jgi:hypothetical protein
MKAKYNTFLILLIENKKGSKIPPQYFEPFFIFLSKLMLVW